MANRILLEVIASSLDDARNAVAGGADRLELCGALAMGGLTPSLGTLRAIKRESAIPVMSMVRPREGGMAYSEGEFQAMVLDAEIFVEEGADGLVFGFLTSDGDLDVSRCRSFLQRVRAAAGARSVQTVFHRAFDVVANPERALEQLVELGVDRILTSGREPLAVEGVAAIRRYIELSAGRIEILPGGGITLDTLERVVSETGADQVHLYLGEPGEDRSVVGNPGIYFGAHLPSSELEVREVRMDAVRRVRQALG
jgi:copper homeostasis protein